MHIELDDRREIAQGIRIRQRDIPRVKAGAPDPEVLDFTVLSGDGTQADTGIVRALVDIRRDGVTVRDCRLIQQHDGTLRLYGPQVRKCIPGTDEVIFRTLVDWPESESLRMGQVVIEASL